MAVEWTQEQRQVIELRDRNILVSAAAGSGKTAVLVERIIARLTRDDPPADVDRLLVVTYTEAAAAEMKERIAAAIERAMEEQPENLHLKRQSSLIHSARITTIHSFCLSVIREYFHTIDLDPGFRVGEEGELTLLRQDVMKEMLEDRYQEGTPEFLQFVETFATGREDARLEELILRLYEFAGSYPEPEQWLDGCAAVYEEGIEGDPPYLERILAYVRNSLTDVWADMERAREICQEADGPYMYEKTIDEDAALLGPLFEVFSEQKEEQGGCAAERYRAASGVWARMGNWPRLAANRDKKVDGEKSAQVKALRESWKKRTAGLGGSFFFQPPEEMEADLALCRPVMRMLTELVKEFQRRFSQRKAEKNLIDFRDMEQFALQILTRREDGRRVPSETAREYQEQFLEVMVDEYQDSNLIQEAILTSVSRESRGEYNLFMVGDVKQSIYRFRLSRPELFLDKYDRYSTQEGVLRRIDLHRNFRSRREVLDAANAVFRQIMTRKLGNVDYDERAALYPGADYPASQGNEAEILIVDPEADEADARAELPQDADGAAAKAQTGVEQDAAALRADSRELEARAVAERIHILMEEQQIWDAKEGAFRPVRYGDIVVLTRSLAGWTDVFSQVLSQEGIPTVATSREGYFETLEIGWMLDYLRVLDNTRQDLPLAAVLRSPFGGCTNEELAQIRLHSPELPFCEAALRAAGYGGWEDAGVKTEKTDRQAAEKLPEAALRAAGYGGWDETDVRIEEMDTQAAENVPETVLQAAGYGGWDEVGAKAEKTDRQPAGKLPVALRGKLRRIFAEICGFRERLPYTSIHDLLWQIMKETGYRNYVAAMPGGEQRLANLEMLAARAKAFESTSYKGLFHFVRYVEQLKKYNVDYGEAGLYGDQAQAVRLMSIHKSKGLEFPVVIVAGMGKRFNRQDVRASVVIHPDLGLGIDAVDTLRRTKCPTLIKKAIQTETDLENLGEELRVLYVAMTRAKEKLILVGSLADAEEKLSGYADAADPAEETLSFTRLAGANTYFDWVLPAALRSAAPSLLRVQVWGPRQLEGRAQAREVQEELDKRVYLRRITDPGDPLSLQDDAFARRLEEQFSYRYPYDGEGQYKLKYTVSELKKRASLGADDQTGELLVEEEDVIPLIPDFLKEQKELTGASRGSAYHKLLELLDFSGEYTADSLAEAVEAFRQEGMLDAEMADCIRIPDLLHFLETDAGRRMCRAARAGRLFREQPFVFGVDAGEFYPQADAGELVLIQGIIDVYFEEEDGLVVLDYKTDQVRTARTLVEKYQEQLHLYARALTQLTQKPVKEKIIYSFTLGEEIHLE